MLRRGGIAGAEEIASRGEFTDKGERKRLEKGGEADISYSQGWRKRTNDPAVWGGERKRKGAGGGGSGMLTYRRKPMRTRKGGSPS